MEHKNTVIQWNKKYTVLWILLLLVELLIAVFVHDRIIRPLVGDILVVFLLYCIIKSIFIIKSKWFPCYLFLFSTLIEFCQYFDLASMLGINNPYIRIIFGSTFDWMDIVCYGIGSICLIFWQRYEAVVFQQKK